VFVCTVTFNTFDVLHRITRPIAIYVKCHFPEDGTPDIYKAFTPASLGMHEIKCIAGIVFGSSHGPSTSRKPVAHAMPNFA